MVYDIIQEQEQLPSCAPPSINLSYSYTYADTLQFFDSCRNGSLNVDIELVYGNPDRLNDYLAKFAFVEKDKKGNSYYKCLKNRQRSRSKTKALYSLLLYNLCKFSICKLVVTNANIYKGESPI